MFDASVFKYPSPDSEMAYVNRNFKHEINGNFIISTDINSYRTQHGRHYPSFSNEYHSNKWVMLCIQKYPLFSSPCERIDKIPYNASTVNQKQYELVSQERGFYGSLPDAITRKSVINFDTLRATQGYKGKRACLLRIFMSNYLIQKPKPHRKIKTPTRSENQ